MTASVPVSSAEQHPAGPAGGPPAPFSWHRIRRALGELADPRFRWFHQLILVGSVVLFFVTLLRFDEIIWGQRLTQAGYQLFIAAWFMAISYPVRTVGFREVVRFWLMGFFTVVFLTYLITRPMRSLLGSGNLQSGVWAPLVEEILKILPVVAWTTIMRSKFRHGTLSDFWILGFAIGAGFSFHEDSLYARLASSGFGGGFHSTLFPTTYATGQDTVIVHSGWATVAALGVGVIVLYRHRWWGWACGIALLAVPVLDHGAANWRGSDVLATLTGHGDLAAVLLVLSVPIAIGHDAAVLRWVGRRDASFPVPRVRDDLAALSTAGVDDSVAGLLWNQRYRRLRNAVFVDLYRTRSRGRPPGDRRAVVRQLATTALHAQKPVDPRLARAT